MQLNIYWIVALVLLAAALAGLWWLIRYRRSQLQAVFSEDEAAGEAAGMATEPEMDMSRFPVWGRVDVTVEGKRISTHRVHRATITIGRDPGRARIVIPELIVSKLHCLLFEREGALWIKDAGSTNGLFYEGEAVMEREVHHGDVFSLGRRGSVKLVFTTDPPLEG